MFATHEVRAIEIFTGLGAYERNQVTAWGTAFTTYETDGDDVCLVLETLCRTWTQRNYAAGCKKDGLGTSILNRIGDIIGEVL